MLKIEPIEEVITKRKLIVELDEDEMVKILIDARPFQKELRKQRAKWYGPAGWKLNGNSPARAKKAAHPKAAEKKSGKARGVKCPKCHKVFKALGRHSASCTGNKDPLASVRAPSPLDE